MTEAFEEKLTSMLSKAVEAEEEARKDLTEIVKNIILSKIRRGERKWKPVEAFIEISKVLALKANPENEPIRRSVQRTGDELHKEKMDLMSEYNQTEPYIDLLNGMALYDLIRKLRGKARLKTIFESVRTSPYGLEAIRRAGLEVVSLGKPKSEPNNLSTDNFARWSRDQSHNRKRSNTLTASALTDKRKRLALLYRKSHTLHRFCNTLFSKEIGRNIFD